MEQRHSEVHPEAAIGPAAAVVRLAVLGLVELLRTGGAEDRVLIVHRSHHRAVSTRKQPLRIPQHIILWFVNAGKMDLQIITECL